MKLLKGFLALLFIFSTEATFIHKCHDCTDESCNDLIPTDLTGKCETKAHGKCFIRQDPNGLTYRGCADEGHWPDLDYSYVGCQLQRYGAWDYKKVLWCFCDFDLCNTNVTAVREFYQTRQRESSSSNQQTNINQANSYSGTGGGYQNQKNVYASRGGQSQQTTQYQPSRKTSGHSNHGGQNSGNLQQKGYVKNHSNQQVQQGHKNIKTNQQPKGGRTPQAQQGYQKYHQTKKSKVHPQQKINGYIQKPNHEKAKQGQGQEVKHMSSGTTKYSKNKFLKRPIYARQQAQQTSINTKGKSKSQYYFKPPSSSTNQQLGSLDAQKSTKQVYHQKSVKSLKSKQQLPPIVIVPIDPPKQTYMYEQQGGIESSKSYQQHQQQHIQAGRNPGVTYNQQGDQQGQQQVDHLSNNIPHGHHTFSTSQHSQVDASGQYYDLHSGQGERVQPGQLQGSQVVSPAGANGKTFWNNVIHALLNGEEPQSGSQQGGVQAEGNNQVSCQGGQIWTNCGGCDLTCSGVQPCLAVCVPKCQCPQKLPVLHNGVCTTAEKCPTQGGGQAVNTGSAGATFIYPSGVVQPGDFGIGITIDTDLYSNSGSPAKESGAVITRGGNSQQQGTRIQPPVNIVCSSNQIWTSCGSACLATCDNYLTLTCIRSCVPGCHCPPQLPIWHQGKCIRFETCPAGPNQRPPSGCPGNQVWTEQGKPCTPTCQDPTPQCARRFVARCQCPQNLPILQDGVCMSLNQCPSQQSSVCPSNQVYMECGSACVATCESYRDLVCTLQCKAGCHCPLLTPVWHNNLCIHASQCPNKDIRPSGEQQGGAFGLQTRQGQGLAINYDQGQGYGQSSQEASGQTGVHGLGITRQRRVQGHVITGQGAVQGHGITGQAGVQGHRVTGQAGVQGHGITGQGGADGHGIGLHVGVHRQGAAGQSGVQGHGITGRVQGQGGIGVQGQGTSAHSRFGIGVGVEKQGPDSGSINEVDSGFSIITKTGKEYTKGGCYSGACDQICSVKKNKPVCSCRNGYILQQDGKTCKDFDECSINNGRCSQMCTNTQGSFHCSCKSGYRLNKDGKTCVDINECHRNSGGCSHTCENTEGSYKCVCPQGYQLGSDLHSCTDIDECQSGGVRCQQTCMNTEGSYHCTCSEGYTLNQDGWTCEDLNECNAKSHGCEHYCLNKRGTYSCMCMAGYEVASDGHSCTDIDECMVMHGGGCSHECTNTLGSYQCACPTGYGLDLDGRRCSDINECQNNNGGCMHICENSQGSYSCLCQPGYTLSPDGKSCTSLDTCADNNGGCSQLCESLPSGARCGCRDGYKLDQDDKTCIDVDECGVKNGGCGQLCINTQGSYSCACTRGYRIDVGRKLCLDVNECLNQNGGCANSCENLLGSFRCTCPYGYTVAPDGFQCTDVNECLSQNGGCGDLCVNTEGSFECACRGDLFRLSPDGRSCEALCPDGFIKSDFVNSCYRVFQDTNAVKNVTDAMETCQSLHPLAALVDIESQQERLFLSSLLANNPVMLEGWQGWWTSGVYRPIFSQFQWGTGSYLDNDSLLWGFKKTPYQDTCVWILQMPVYDYTVGNFDCKTESGFICEIKVPSRSLVT